MLELCQLGKFQVRTGLMEHMSGNSNKQLASCFKQILSFLPEHHSLCSEADSLFIFFSILKLDSCQLNDKLGRSGRKRSGNLVFLRKCGRTQTSRTSHRICWLIKLLLKAIRENTAEQGEKSLSSWKSKLTWTSMADKVLELPELCLRAQHLNICANSLLRAEKEKKI